MILKLLTFLNFLIYFKLKLTRSNVKPTISCAWQQKCNLKFLIYLSRRWESNLRLTDFRWSSWLPSKAVLSFWENKLSSSIFYFFVFLIRLSCCEITSRHQKDILAGDPKVQLIPGDQLEFIFWTFCVD